ncbi:histidinol-phosphate transaminase [Paludibacterium paludis]|uniref:Histidinol-phosphate aminotransferase n=1 Tax=Paludibacterium paludis TaxID=1225769 RepID=A0A918U9S7_9NEIS|nr:histidinol-phosphate transaminase [Paludibacterium paludis]GGY15431.1 histidinol-phosphate aminotransferase 2 [Paludibacterium paludis]
MKQPVDQLIRPDILAMKAYPVADAAGFIKLDAMENPWRLSESLLAELGSLLAEAHINRYPDPAGGGLKEMLRVTAGIPAGADILLGNGSDELITLITQALARPGATVMALEPSFVMYRLNAVFSRVNYVGVPLNQDFSLNLPVLLDAIAKNQPAVIFLAYPNNPTGNRYAREDVLAVLETARGLVVIDEAYGPFADDSFMSLAGSMDNLIVMRTLSKVGLAGIRLGYAAGQPDWIHELDKVRAPYNVNVLTQITARFALTHSGVFEEQASQLRKERSHLAEALSAYPGVTVYPSEANFLTMRLPDADLLYAWLKSRRILIKNLGGMHPMLENCLRFTVGSPEENRAVIAALDEYFQ